MTIRIVAFRPAKKGAPSCVGTISFGRACLAEGRCQNKKICNWLAFRCNGTIRSVHGQNRFFIRVFVTF